MSDFNKREFAILLKNAIGEYSINEYGRMTKVSGAHISRLTRSLNEKPPGADTIKKLASHAQNNVTYEDLMVAAGYLSKMTDEESAIKAMIEEDLNKKRIKKFADIAPDDLAEEFEKLGFEIISLAHEKKLSRKELETLIKMLRAID